MAAHSSLMERFIAFESEKPTFPWTAYILLIFIVLSSFHFILDRLFYGRLSHVPGPKLAALSWYYISYLDLRHCRHKKIMVRIRPNDVTLSDPNDYHEIYDTKSRYDKTALFKLFTLYGEDNLFSTIKYSDHQAKKRKIAVFYAKSSIAATAEDLVRERVQAVLTEMMAAPPSGLVDVFALFYCYAHDVMTRFLYGVSHGTDAVSDPKERPFVADLKCSQVWGPLWVNFSWFHGSWAAKVLLGNDYRRSVEAMDGVRRQIEKQLEEHDNDPKKDDQFSLYREMRLAKKEGDHLSRKYMASEMFDHLTAGQQTTASALTYIAWRLSRHVEWQRRVQAELCAVTPDVAGNVPLNDTEACPILDAVVRETLRCHPAASDRQERVVPSGGRTYSGVFVPEGTTVIDPTLVLHHNPSAFPDPHSWRPERWLEAGEIRLKEIEYSFAPFGHGARICIGQHLAMMEIRLLLSSIYRKFSTRLSDSCTDESMEQIGTLEAVPGELRCELFMEEI